MKFLKRFWVLALLIAMVAVFLFIATRSDGLRVYNSDTGQSTYTVTQEPETEASIEEMTVYQNDGIDFYMLIPAGWEYVLKDGYDTYVHAASASSIQIQILSYYPMVNNLSMESVQETYTGYGYTVTEFAYMTTSSYYCIYQSYTTSGVVDYIEWVLWDRQNVVKIVVCVNDGNYDRLQDEIWTSINSISWNQADPIDPSLYLHYQSAGDFEFAVPISWTDASTEDAFYAYDEQTGSDITVSVLEDSTMAGEISQVDYASYLSRGLDSFVLTGIEQGSNYFYGEGTFYVNGMQCAVLQAYVTNGTYHYVITWEYPVDYGDSYLSLARTGIALTRIFYEGEVTDGISYVDSETGESYSKETETEDVFNAQSEAIAEAAQEMGREEEENNEPDAEEEEVGTFAEALISVSGITFEQAEYIEYVWNYRIGTDPVYASAYMKTDTELVLYVQDSSGTDYYLWLSLETGDLLQINVGTYDGDVILP